jgi:casein kinase 1
MHQKSLIHRDIKPENIILGLKEKDAHLIYLVDFGLCKSYRDKTTKKHIPFRSGKSLTGTARYASAYSHQGLEQSRRDDLCSATFVLAIILKGTLPWVGIEGASKEERYHKIMTAK